MSADRFVSRSRFEGSIEAKSLPVVGADRRRDRAQLLRLVVAGVAMFWTGVFVAVVALCA